MDDEWVIYIVDEVRSWIDKLDDASHRRIVQALDALAQGGPGLGRPLVDTITGTSMSNLKELRPGSVRILFAFDPWRSSILLVGGDKRDRWQEWYHEAIPLAERRYILYLEERATQQEEGDRQ
ncbi:type II toxin-antitoxin system RelE/ParE family toxin [Mangrovactinospora gilvigrisea]|uniref:type II toxin-antitoxin system RelE/ParE family toxin n=1 Tax=Mangrovactinospora gilvigrisea TaxID=1428644 RepID=UPI001C319E43|nr:type II toxin-antitoxin system RelE/ParE family toxin [Mangrovactinospora gilvigrisea]